MERDPGMIRRANAVFDAWFVVNFAASEVRRELESLRAWHIERRRALGHVGGDTGRDALCREIDRRLAALGEQTEQRACSPDGTSSARKGVQEGDGIDNPGASPGKPTSDLELDARIWLMAEGATSSGAAARAPHYAAFARYAIAKRDYLAQGEQPDKASQRLCSWVGSDGMRCEREAGHDTHSVTRPVPRFEDDNGPERNAADEALAQRAERARGSSGGPRPTDTDAMGSERLTSGAPARPSSAGVGPAPLSDADVLLRELVGVVQWMSGSHDFTPEGKAGAYWAREGLPELKRAMAYLGPPAAPAPDWAERLAQDWCDDPRAGSEALAAFLRERLGPVVDALRYAAVRGGDEEDRRKSAQAALRSLEGDA